MLASTRTFAGQPDNPDAAGSRPPGANLIRRQVPAAATGSGAGPGHRATGDRTSRNRGIGWEVLHVAIDAATRLVYAELLPDERGRTTARFLVRAMRWFRSHDVRVERLLTDNGSPYRSHVFGRARRWLGLRHSRTRPYRPQTNGKA
jgi:transposase InsO family protein